MRRRRVTYRPSKTQSVFAGIVGVIFVFIGIFVAIPNFGLFGILWTLIAIGVTAVNFYQAFSGKYIGPEISIEDEDPAQSAPPASYQPGQPVPGTAAADRLRQLEDLRRSGLITQSEYEAKRQEILRGL